MTADTKVTLSGAPSDCAYSPDGKYFVTADSNRKVTLFNAGDYSKAVQREWGFHSAKVNCVAFSPDRYINLTNTYTYLRFYCDVTHQSQRRIWDPSSCHTVPIGFCNLG